MPPQIRILLFILFSIFLFTVISIETISIAAFATGLLLFSVPVRRLKAGIFPIGIFLLFTFVSNLLQQPGRILFQAGSLYITHEGLEISLVRTLRIFSMIGSVKVLMSHTSSEDMVKGMEKLSSPLEKTGLPVKDFFSIMGLTINALPVIMKTVSKGFHQKSTGGNALSFRERASAISSFLLPFFVNSLKSPEEFFEKDIIRDKTE